jgi:uncharacterized membrane protein YphA (DoxX/SURF4 family)
MTTIRKYVPTTARLFLGLIFTVMGANGFFHFLPMPPPAPRPAAFVGALFASGYLIQLVMATELVAGLLLLARRFVPLALTLLAPVIVNIVAFHAFLAPKGMGLALAVLVAELVVAWDQRAAFAPLFQSRWTPDAATASPLTSVPARARQMA